MISLVDLGVVRDVDWDGETLVVGVTPTYSGCPATSIINLDIERSLCALGVEKSTPRAPARAALDDGLDQAGGAREASGLRHRAAGRGQGPGPAH